MATHINLDQVTSIEVNLKKENRNLQFLEHWKLFSLITILKDGWYDCSRFESKFLTKDLIPDEEFIPSNTYIDGLTAYYNPHLVFNMTDKSKHIQYYETKEALDREFNWIRDFRLKNLIVIIK